MIGGLPEYTTAIILERAMASQRAVKLAWDQEEKATQDAIKHMRGGKIGK